MNHPVSPPQTEQRLTFRLLSYWSRIRGEKKMASLSDVHIEEIQELWNFSFVIDVREAEHKFHFFGSELATIFHENYNGRSVQAAINEDIIINNTIGFYEKAIHAEEPVLEAASFWSEGDEVKYRSIIVPLSTDGKTIDFLMGTTNYKRFASSK